MLLSTEKCCFFHGAGFGIFGRHKILCDAQGLHTALCTTAYLDISHSNLMRYEASRNTDLCRNVPNDLHYQCK